MIELIHTEKLNKDGGFDFLYEDGDAYEGIS
jgi:hypothetical protein